jgi:hypothetical protein
MKRHVALTLLAITTLGILNAHVDLPRVDGRRFVQAQGELHDPLGWWEDQWTQLTRRCGSVRAVPAGSALERASLDALRGYSPPDSQSARLLQLHSVGDWLLAELEFETLSPAMVVLRVADGRPQVVERAIWSGDTRPWRPAPLIRRHLAAQAPDLPTALLDCLTPQGDLFRPR